jgi:hypothetical protein
MVMFAIIPAAATHGNGGCAQAAAAGVRCHHRRRQSGGGEDAAACTARCCSCSGRRGESIKVARALNGAINLKVLEKDADEAIKAGTGLVACRRRSSTSRRSRAVVGQVCGGVGHEGVRVPTTVKQVLMYMSHMSRTRERACLAHRGERREGRQKSVAKNRSTCRRQYSTQQTV